MGTSETARSQPHKADLSEEFSDSGTRIARALIASHGHDRAYLERTQESFVHEMERCLRCKYYKRGQCPGCMTSTFVLAAIETHLAKMPAPAQASAAVSP